MKHLQHEDEFSFYRAPSWLYGKTGIFDFNILPSNEPLDRRAVCLNTEEKHAETLRTRLASFN